MRITELAEATTQDQVKIIWNATPDLKKDKDFIQAVKDAGARVKPKPEAQKPEPVAPNPGGSEGAEHDQTLS